MGASLFVLGLIPPYDAGVVMPWLAWRDAVNGG